MSYAEFRMEEAPYVVRKVNIEEVSEERTLGGGIEMYFNVRDIRTGWLITARADELTIPCSPFGAIVKFGRGSYGSQR
jgi:hypothetical protein